MKAIRILTAIVLAALLLTGCDTGNGNNSSRGYLGDWYLYLPGLTESGDGEGLYMKTELEETLNFRMSSRLSAEEDYTTDAKGTFTSSDAGSTLTMSYTEVNFSTDYYRNSDEDYLPIPFEFDFSKLCTKEELEKAVEDFGVKLTDHIDPSETEYGTWQNMIDAEFAGEDITWAVSGTTLTLTDSSGQKLVFYPSEQEAENAWDNTEVPEELSGTAWYYAYKDEDDYGYDKLEFEGSEMIISSKASGDTGFTKMYVAKGSYNGGMIFMDITEIYIGSYELPVVDSSPSWFTSELYTKETLTEKIEENVPSLDDLIDPDHWEPKTWQEFIDEQYRGMTMEYTLNEAGNIMTITDYTKFYKTTEAAEAAADAEAEASN